MSDPNETGGVSATIKYPESSRYASDNPWIVFHGSVERIREDIIAAFGLDDGAKDQSLSELVLQAQGIATATKSAITVLGGKPAGQSAGQNAAWDKARESGTKEPAKSTTFAHVENSKSIDELKRVWAENKAEFDSDPVLMVAYRSKGKALKKAEAEAA